MSAQPKTGQPCHCKPGGLYRQNCPDCEGTGERIDFAAIRNKTTEAFGPVIFSYTRKQALADGYQVDATSTAKEAGIKFPLFITRAVWDAYVAVPEGVEAQDEAGRLWDVVWMTRFAIIRSATGGSRLPVALYVRNDNRRAKLVKLVAVCGPRDIDDPSPAITVMMPDED